MRERTFICFWLSCFVMCFYATTYFIFMFHILVTEKYISMQSWDLRCSCLTGTWLWSMYDTAETFTMELSSVSTTGERIAIFPLYVVACYRDIGCVAVYNRRMRCRTVYHVQGTSVWTTGECMAIFLLYMVACYRDIGCVTVYKRGMRYRASCVSRAEH